MSDLKSRLQSCAEMWCAAHDGAPLSRIGKQVAGDANFFVRIAVPTASLNVSTLERFARFLGDPANWPDSVVPEVVSLFAHAVSGTDADAVPSSGKVAKVSTCGAGA